MKKYLRKSIYLKVRIIGIFCSLLIMSNSSALDLNDQIQEKIDQLTEEQKAKLKDTVLFNKLEKFVELENKVSEAIKLTPEDKNALKVLGYTDEEINNLDMAKIIGSKAEHKKLGSNIKDYGERKTEEIDKGVNKNLVPGLASSIINLGFATALGPIVAVKCYNHPSAIAFAGTSAAWVGLEMMTWNGYQLEMKDVESLQDLPKVVQEISDKIESIESRVQAIKNIDLNEFESDPINSADGAVNDLDKNLASIKEDILDLKRKLDEINSNQVVAFKGLLESLKLAAETTKKKARNAKTAAIGFTAASGLSIAESFNVFQGLGACAGIVSQNDSTLLKLLNLIAPKAHAKNALVPNFDKLGIPVGAGVAAAYLAFKGKFLNKIIANGTSRSVAFSVMAGSAYLTASKLRKASQFLNQQIFEVETFINFFEKRLLQGGDLLMDEPIKIIDYARNELIPSAKEKLAHLKEQQNKVEEFKDLIQQGQTEVAETLKDKAKDYLTNNGDKVLDELANLELSETADQLEHIIIEEQLKDNGINPDDFNADEFLSFSSMPSRAPSYMDWIISPAMAAPHPGKASCFVIRPGYYQMDQNCGCAKANKCTTAMFPKNLKYAKDTKTFDDIIKLNMGLMDGFNDILTLNPKRGFKKIAAMAPLAQKVSKQNYQLISHKIGQAFTPKHVAMGVKKNLDQARPAVKDYLRDQNTPLKQVASLRSRVHMDKALGSKIPSKLKSKILRDIALAQAIQKPNRHSSQSNSKATYHAEEFTSSMEGDAIQSDSSKNIFLIIKQRYFRILNDGRL